MKSASIVLGLLSQEFYEEIIEEKKITKYNCDTGEPYETSKITKSFKVGQTIFSEKDMRGLKISSWEIHRNKDRGFTFQAIPIEDDSSYVWGVCLHSVDDDEDAWKTDLESKELDLVKVEELRPILHRFLQEKWGLTDAPLKLFLVGN